MENKRPETEEERRERVRRARARKELHQQRMRKKRLIRLSVYILIGILGVLLVVAVIAIVHKVQDGRAEQAVEEAIQEEITNSSFYDSSEVLHLSFPVLSLDTAGSGLSVSQFSLILEDLYAAGYVLIDPYELAARTEKGFASAQIMVPAGKKPLILSQYDVSYKEGDKAHATALTKDASGRISCIYYDEYGSLITGAVDVVPIVESFIEAHPDFSYKGARGILGVTGYGGVLGYTVEVDESLLKTVKIDRPAQDEEDQYGEAYGEDLYGEEAYGEDLYGGDAYGEGLTDEDAYGEELTGEETYGEETAGGDAAGYDSETTTAESASEAAENEGASEEEAAEEAEARKQAEETAGKNRETAAMLLSTLRSGGWRIASNTYEGSSYASSVEIMQADAEKWNTVIAPITGTADILMLPDGADIGEWSGYTDSNERYTLLRDLGFRYFFVGNDETRTWAQVRPAYVRQSMHEIKEYAAYLAVMNMSEAPAAAAADEAAGGSAEDALQTNGTLELVGEALQSGGAGIPADTAEEALTDTAEEAPADTAEEIPAEDVLAEEPAAE